MSPIGSVASRTTQESQPPVRVRSVKLDWRAHGWCRSRQVETNSPHSRMLDQVSSGCARAMKVQGIRLSSRLADRSLCACNASSCSTSPASPKWRHNLRRSRTVKSADDDVSRRCPWNERHDPARLRILLNQEASYPRSVGCGGWLSQPGWHLVRRPKCCLREMRRTV